MNFRFGTYVIDGGRLELGSDGALCDLEPQVFYSLMFLIQNRDRVVSKDEMIEAVWDGRIVSGTTLNARINGVRRAVGDNGKDQAVIRTYPRRGFRFVAQVETDTRMDQAPPVNPIKRFVSVTPPTAPALPMPFRAAARRC